MRTEPATGEHLLRGLTEANGLLGTAYRWQRQLQGGDQNGAHLVRDGDQLAVLKWQVVPWKAMQLLQAFPAISDAAAHGWPVARWLVAGPLGGGGAFVLQEYVSGAPLTQLDPATMKAVLAANSLQSGLAFSAAADDSSHIEAVLNGDIAWKSNVAAFTPAGAELVQHGDDVATWAADATVPVTDVVHGDYSSSNMLLAADGSIRLVDCETVKRGSRVRDLADLYRQTFAYPGTAADSMALLRAAASAVAGPRVFAKCAVAVTYDNLAWWVEHKTPAEFDVACANLHRLSRTYAIRDAEPRRSALTTWPSTLTRSVALMAGQPELAVT